MTTESVPPNLLSQFYPLLSPNINCDEESWPCEVTGDDINEQFYYDSVLNVLYVTSEDFSFEQNPELDTGFTSFVNEIVMFFHQILHPTFDPGFFSFVGDRTYSKLYMSQNSDRQIEATKELKFDEQQEALKNKIFINYSSGFDLNNQNGCALFEEEVFVSDYVNDINGFVFDRCSNDGIALITDPQFNLRLYNNGDEVNMLWSYLTKQLRLSEGYNTCPDLPDTDRSLCQECSNDDECGYGMLCDSYSNKCKLEVNSPCDYNSQCYGFGSEEDDSLTCVADFCVPLDTICDDDFDCSDNLYCNYELGGVCWACGNNYLNHVDPWIETCDDGNIITEVCDYGEPDCQVCNSSCQEVHGETSFCGDNDVQEDHETCDDGSDNGLSGFCYDDCNGWCGDDILNGDSTMIGSEICDASNLNGESCLSLGFTGGVLSCNSSCHFNTSLCTSSCGDGAVQTPNGEGVYEACDDGSDNGLPGFCYADCSGWCGDNGVQEDHETCDDGSDNGLPGFCYADCNGWCGDNGVQEDHETCDDGSDNGLPGFCYQDCGGWCGDGILQELPLESCDDGSANGGPGFCYQTCNGWCGDGVVNYDDGETCDGSPFWQCGATPQGYFTCEDCHCTFHS